MANINTAQPPTFTIRLTPEEVQHAVSLWIADRGGVKIHPDRIAVIPEVQLDFSGKHDLVGLNVEGWE